MSTATHGAEQLPDSEALKRDTEQRITAAMMAQHRKAQLEAALDSALNVIAQTQNEIRAHSEDFNTGDRQKLATTLEQMGRLCWSVARECERQKGAR